MRLFVLGKSAVLTGVIKMAKSNKTNAMAQAVKTLSQVKRETVKPSKVEYIATVAHIDLAREAGTWGGTINNAQIEFNKCAQALREAKVVIGDARTCPLAKAFLAARFKIKVAASTKANALASFRKAVSDGKDYSENAYRKEKKQAAKTGAKTSVAKTETESEDGEETADGEAKSFSVSIARKGSAKKAAQVLRDLMNKLRDSEEYAPLAALILDSLDEFDGTE